MANFIEVRAVDVRGGRVSGATFTASIDGNAAVPIPESTDKGVYRIQLPAGAARASVQGNHKDFFPVVQSFTMDTTRREPTARFDGGQAINVRLLTVTTAAEDFHIELHVVLGQLRDKTEAVHAISAAAGQPMVLPPVTIPILNTPFLIPKPTPSSMFAGNSKSVTPLGPVLFAERTTVPRLIAIAHPGFNNPINNRQNAVPLPYHLFFHPFFDDNFNEPDYPFGPGYIDVAFRYLFEGPPLPPNSPKFPNARLAYQNVASFPSNILIFPIASQTEKMGTLTTQDEVLRLLQEVNYWVQRMRGVPYPLQPVGRSALSSFSGGTNHLNTILGSQKSPDFYDRILRNVYLFDGVVDGGQTAWNSFAGRVLAWLRGGANGRSLHVYTQYPGRVEPFMSAMGQMQPTPSKAGAIERESAVGTLLFAPLPFWRLADPTASEAGVHHAIVRLFAEHAVASSSFNT